MGGGGEANIAVLIVKRVQYTNAKQKKTLDRIFRKQAPSDLLWKDIESFFKHIGFSVKSSGGSAVAIFKYGFKPMIFHGPHPGPHTQKASVKEIRTFLDSIGVRP